MTERAFGKSWNSWTGKVTSVNDPDQSGRIQVRIRGLHDDQTNIPDSDLLWAIPAPDVTNASWNKIGTTPVGVIVGAIAEGYWLDVDQQIPVFTHTGVKAGDPQSNSATTTSGQVPLANGTNSSPLGGRIANNAFVTRKGQDITKDDQTGSQGPQEQKDSDGQDVTKQAQANTKYGAQPTVGSIANPSGSILQQILQVDPKNVGNVLPNALQSFIKIKDLNAASTTGGVNGILGQALGLVGGQLGASAQSGMNSLNNNPALSTTSQSVLETALEGMSANVSLSQISSTMQSILGQSIPALAAALQQLISTNSLNPTTFNALMAQFFSEVQNNAAQQTIGTNQNNILNELESIIPQVAGALQSTLNIHLPSSVLNNSIVTQALQRFAMAQAFLKASQGKKALAIQATTGPVTQGVANGQGGIGHA